MTLPAGLTTDANAALPLHIVTRAEFAQWCTTQPTAVARWLDAQAFDGSAYTALVVPGADVFDALTQKRPYKAAWPIADAIAEIERGRGKQFDPVLVDAFLRVVRRTPAA